MARDLLTVPVSIVASEKDLSAGGRFIDNRPMMLPEEMVETYMCLQDWFQSESRTQHLMEKDKKKMSFRH